MEMNKSARTPWHDEGFAEPPEEKLAVGGEVIYRAYGGSSKKLGNCFFVPAVNGTLVGHWTAELLENELNAALWGNDFERVTKFQILKGINYKIGPIAHDKYSGVDGASAFYQRAFFTPSGIFKQVTFFKDPSKGWSHYVKEIGEFSLGAGRYAREASKRAKKYNQ